MLRACLVVPLVLAPLHQVLGSHRRTPWAFRQASPQALRAPFKLVNKDRPALLDLARSSKALTTRPRYGTCNEIKGAHMGSLLRDIVFILTNSCRMGELEPWIDENFVRSVWYGLGENVNVKMIRDKFSG